VTPAIVRWSRRRDGERGLTLVELLVAFAILLVAIAGVLSLYDAVWDSFKQGENTAAQQQGVRIAFERIGRDLQMAGFNHNPDGDPARPDEQIEAAYDTAIAIRADFDGQDATLAVTPESTLAGGAFDVVSTGNDEVVVYYLAKPDGSSTDQLTFDADLKDPTRDGGLETVRIRDVALIQDDPPYTLYRATLSNDPDDWNTSDFVDATVLAEGIGSMSFRYFDEAGNPINPTPDLDDLGDDIGGAESAAVERGRIRRVEVDLLGLALDPEPGWVDRSDPDPRTRPFHKFRLASNITPRNLGMVGIPDDADAAGGGP